MVKRILITDDDKKLVKRYKKILEKAGYETDCAYNGQESLEKLKEGKVDLLILDLQMPVMSGDKVLNIIRADEPLKKTKVLVTSSFAYTEELVWQVNGFRKKRRMTNVGRKAQKEGEANRGWNGGLSVLAKLKMGIKEILYYGGKSTCPESQGEFHDRIEDWLLNEVKGLLEYEPDSFEREKATGEPDRVLIVDDDKGMVKRIASWLKPEGYQLFFAYNGTEALDKIAKEDIDLVVLDLEMPETKGDEVIQVMNSIDVLAKIPIIIFSSTTGMTTYKDLISSKGKKYNEPKGSEESYSLFGDKSKPLLNKVKSELKERCRLGHGYKKHPITIIRKKNGQWMNGFLEAYVPVVKEDVRQSLNCCYCEEKKIPAYTAEFSFSDYHICRDCAHELKVKYPGFANKHLTV